MGVIISTNGGGGGDTSNVITTGTQAIQISGGAFVVMIANLNLTMNAYVGYRFLSFTYSAVDFQGVLIVAPI
jgi:hypothetical protein